MKNWMKTAATEAIEEMLPDLREFVATEVSGRTGVVGYEQKQIWIGGGNEYPLVSTETGSYELVTCMFDLSKMVDGDSMEIMIDIKFPWGVGRHLTHSVEGKQDVPAIGVPEMLCPSGVDLKLKHNTGKDFQIGYVVLRRQ